MEDKDSSRLARKLTWTLFSAQSLGSAGFILAATVSSIVGAKLGNNPAWAGVPSAVYLLLSAFSAPVWGYTMDRLGRRGGITIGLILGVVGAGVAAAAIVASSFLAFVCGLGLMGVAQAALSLGRFAAAEVNPPEQRGRAISYVVLGGTVGAILGPLLVGVTGQRAAQAGFDELVGPFITTLILFILACLVIFILLRPDPRDLGREIARLHPETLPSQGPARSPQAILRQPAAMVAVIAMVIGQMVMVMVMVITSLHMKNHEHNLNQIAFVFSSHTIGMFAFSIFSGRLADRLGRGPVILAGSATLILACLAAILSPNVLPLALALFLLGLGWNFCYVGGSSLLADQLAPQERARTQGYNDMLVGLASAVGSLGSGLVFAVVGYGAMALAGAALAIIPLVLVLRWQFSSPKLATSQ